MDALIRKSRLVAKYAQSEDRESAKEILHRKMEFMRESEEVETRKKELEKASKASSRTTRGEKSFIDDLINSPTTRQVTRTVARELTRGLLSVLGVKSSSRRRR